MVPVCLKDKSRLHCICMLVVVDIPHAGFQRLHVRGLHFVVDHTTTKVFQGISPNRKRIVLLSSGILTKC